MSVIRTAFKIFTEDNPHKRYKKIKKLKKNELIDLLDVCVSGMRANNISITNMVPSPKKSKEEDNDIDDESINK